MAIDQLILHGRDRPSLGYRPCSRNSAFPVLARSTGATANGAGSLLSESLLGANGHRQPSQESRSDQLPDAVPGHSCAAFSFYSQLFTSSPVPLLSHSSKVSRWIRNRFPSRLHPGNRPCFASEYNVDSDIGQLSAISGMDMPGLASLVTIAKLPLDVLCPSNDNISG